MFVWMLLVGASYRVKKHFHIGVDVIINIEPAGLKRTFAVMSAIACLSFAILLLIGSWNYGHPFVAERAWYETDDIPMPGFLQFLADWLNEGEDDLETLKAELQQSADVDSEKSTQSSDRKE
jgi:C4-dicarboxylate transporter DctQ subunit